MQTKGNHMPLSRILLVQENNFQKTIINNHSMPQEVLTV